MIAAIFSPCCDATSQENVAKETTGSSKPNQRILNDATLILELGNGSGTGFLLNLKGTVFAITNLHVLGTLKDEMNLRSGVRTLDNISLSITDVFGADGHDIAIMRFSEEAALACRALSLQPDIHQTVLSGDPIDIPGNAQGGGVSVLTSGTVNGIGPTTIEHTAPTFPGNSGSPIFHRGFSTVVGIHSFARHFKIENPFEQASRNDPFSAVKGDVRRFGYRLDSVKSWYKIIPKEFVKQKALVETWNENRQSVVSFLLNFQGIEDNNEWRKDPNLRKIALDYANRVDELSNLRTAYIGTDGLYDYYKKYKVIHPAERARLGRGVYIDLFSFMKINDRKNTVVGFYPWFKEDGQYEIDWFAWLDSYMKSNDNFR